jgi:hypothetical protein
LSNWASQYFEGALVAVRDQPDEYLSENCDSSTAPDIVETFDFV